MAQFGVPLDFSMERFENSGSCALINRKPSEHYRIFGETK